MSENIFEEIKKRPVGTVYYYGGDSECKLEMDKEFMSQHPTMVIDWMDDLIWQAKILREKARTGSDDITVEIVSKVFEESDD